MSLILGTCTGFSMQENRAGQLMISKNGDNTRSSGDSKGADYTWVFSVYRNMAMTGISCKYFVIVSKKSLEEAN